MNYIFTEAAAALSSSIAAKITSRGIETPLGILNKDQVESGDAVLMEIYEVLNEEGEEKAHVSIFFFFFFLFSFFPFFLFSFFPFFLFLLLMHNP